MRSESEHIRLHSLKPGALIPAASRPSDQNRLDSINCHARIAAAITAQDVKTAEACMAEHFDLSVHALLAAGVI